MSNREEAWRPSKGKWGSEGHSQMAQSEEIF